MDTANTTSLELTPVDCACVIVGDAYDWEYVDRLYNMLSRNLTRPVRLHVYTEGLRPVPEPYIKHSVIPWKFADAHNRRWWYKMQLFAPDQFSGPVLYFDLDVVIVKNIDWIVELNTEYFWAVRDFKYLWRPTHYAINSSVMWWNPATFGNIWDRFIKYPEKMVEKYRGDQDFINAELSQKKLRFLHQDRVQSWRWQVLDGGLQFPSKKSRLPGTGANLLDTASLVIFHGNPKPSQITDAVIKQHWR